MYVIIAIILFGVLIAVHEFGHFIAAKSLGVQVNEFSIGMGPAIWKSEAKEGETLYALRALPIGGYCAMEGEDEETTSPYCFSTQPWWKRFIILVAGSFMNFVFGLFLIIIIYMNGSFSTPVVTGFMDGCPYEASDKLMVGDEIYEIDGYRIYFTSNVSQFLNRGDTTHEITVIRDGEKIELEPMEVIGLEYEGQESLMYGFYFGEIESGFLASIKYSWYQSLAFVREVWLSLSDLVAGIYGFDDMSGAVGIVSLISDVGENSASFWIAMQNIAYFGAFIAINLAVMNMLPIPALDGGRIFLMTITSIVEVIFRRKVDPKYEGYIHMIGMLLLLALMAYVMFNDIVRIFT